MSDAEVAAAFADGNYDTFDTKGTFEGELVGWAAGSNTGAALSFTRDTAEGDLAATTEGAEITLDSVVVDGADAGTSVVVNEDGDAITVTFAADATLDDIITALNGDTEAAALVTAALAEEADGTVAAQETTATLAGGVINSLAINISDEEAALVDQLGITLDGVAVDFSDIDFSAVTTGAELATALSSIDGLSANYANGDLTLSTAEETVLGIEDDAYALSSSAGDGTALGTYTINLDNNEIDVAASVTGLSVTADDVVSAINAAEITGLTATLNDDGQVQITKDDHTSFSLTETIQLDGATDAAANAGLVGVDHEESAFNGHVVLNSNSAIVLEEVEVGALANAGLSEVGNGTTTIDNVNISSREGAVEAIGSVDAALQQIDSLRGDLGAVQNRFESTISNLMNVSENLSAARSRILDADIAMETSNMTKQNILQQAGVSILAQANQAPQLALSLLG
ncbi:flagellin [Pelovirga terrestris]